MLLHTLILLSEMLFALYFLACLTHTYSPFKFLLKSASLWNVNIHSLYIFKSLVLFLRIEVIQYWLFLLVTRDSLESWVFVLFFQLSLSSWDLPSPVLGCSSHSILFTLNWRVVRRNRMGQLQLLWKKYLWTWGALTSKSWEEPREDLLLKRGYALSRVNLHAKLSSVGYGTSGVRRDPSMWVNPSLGGKESAALLGDFLKFLFWAPLLGPLQRYSSLWKESLLSLPQAPPSFREPVTS